ncbi:MAG: sialate O-acetylesterase [Suipraeoptans sp.]
MKKVNEKYIDLAEIFQDNMMLQRNKAIKIWGTSKKNQKLSVLIDEVQVYNGEVLAGDFEISLPPQEAAENRTLCIRNGEGEEISIYNVDIGEVWIAGGQSNMEFPLLCDKNGDHTIASADDEHLRYYEVGKYAFEGEREEQLKDDHRWNHWCKFVQEECTHFSAVGTYYAMSLRKKLNVPVAIIGCCWGGTSASTWMRDDLLRADKELQVYTDTYDKAIAKINLEKYFKKDCKNRTFMGSEKNTIGSEVTMKNEVTAPIKFPVKQLAKVMLKNHKTGPHDANRPGGLYQTMLKNIIGFSVRGVIWYQGEGDEQYSALYSRLFTKMIFCWRKEWEDELPFLFVQLAPWEEWMAMDGRNFPEIRAQQQYVEDHVERVYMASIMDVGSRYDIHPKHKEPVGDRLARLAFNEIYGMKQEYCHAPRILKVERSGEDIIVSFDYVEGGLVVKGNIEGLFSVTQNGRNIPFVNSVSKNQIVLTCNGLTEENVVIAFAYRPFLTMNILNQGGLPARPSAPQVI